MILGSGALGIWPKVGVPNVVLTPEAPAVRAGSEIPARKLLVRLKASARTSNLYASRIGNSRESAISSPKKCGPGILLRPKPLSVPGAGVVKAFGLIQQLGLGLAHNGSDSTWTGRSFPVSPFKATSVER